MEPSNNLPQELMECLAGAVENQGSDVHFEPSADKFVIRARYLGRLELIKETIVSQGLQWVAALKNAASIDVTQKQKPQDGRFQLKLHHQSVDCRVNVMPTLWGEKVVIRLLNVTGKLLSLSQIGLLPEQQEQIQKALSHPHGLILTTGPTGSGKTATLYSLLAYLNHSTSNLCSVEDPVEVPIPGINQTEVSSKFERSFAQCLRALLRQDPDVLMVGEIRDAETAQVTLQAAQTGHLVLATLHASHAMAAIVRLLQLQCSHAQIASSLLLLINQRLVRVGDKRHGIFYIHEVSEGARHALQQDPSTKNYWNEVSRFFPSHQTYKSRTPCLS